MIPQPFQRQRELIGWSKKAVHLIALAWFALLLWHLSPRLFFVDWVIYLPIKHLVSFHLGFIILLAFLLYPASQTLKSSTPSSVDIGLGLLGLFASWHVTIYFVAQETQFAPPSSVELIFGCVGLIVLLEAARRAVGLAVMLIGAVSIGYILLGSNLPDFMFVRSHSLQQTIGHLWFSNEGVFDVSFSLWLIVLLPILILSTFLDRSRFAQPLLRFAFRPLARLQKRSVEDTIPRWLDQRLASWSLVGGGYLLLYVFLSFVWIYNNTTPSIFETIIFSIPFTVFASLGTLLLAWISGPVSSHISSSIRVWGVVALMVWPLALGFAFPSLLGLSFVYFLWLVIIAVPTYRSQHVGSPSSLLGNYLSTTYAISIINISMLVWSLALLGILELSTRVTTDWSGLWGLALASVALTTGTAFMVRKLNCEQTWIGRNTHHLILVALFFQLFNHEGLSPSLSIFYTLMVLLSHLVIDGILQRHWSYGWQWIAQGAVSSVRNAVPVSLYFAMIGLFVGMVTLTGVNLIIEDFEAWLISG